MQGQKSFTEWLKDFLEHKVFVALAVTLLVVGLDQFGVFRAVGIPTELSAPLVNTAGAVFGMALTEGRYKGSAYGNGWATWFRSAKNLTLFAQFAIYLLNAGLMWLKWPVIPEIVLLNIGTLAPFVVLALGVAETTRAASAPKPAELGVPQG